jgi:hypothetical protein
VTFNLKKNRRNWILSARGTTMIYLLTALIWAESKMILTANKIVWAGNQKVAITSHYQQLWVAHMYGYCFPVLTIQYQVEKQE